MVRSRQRIILSTLLLGAIGCAGVQCPFQRPSCCDNVLFGCGPFDLPDGCSCSDYFFSSSSAMSSLSTPDAAPMTRARRAFRSTTGVWQLSSRKTNPAACSYLPQTFRRKIVVRESRGRVELKVPGLASLSGSRSGDRVVLTGTRTTPSYGCLTRMSGVLSLASGSSGAVRINLENRCASSSLYCSATYVGDARR